MANKKNWLINSLAFTIWKRGFKKENYKWAKHTLKDGSTIQVDKLAPGGVCLINDKPPAPGTKLVLADGRTLIIGAGGIIGLIQEAKLLTPKAAAQKMQAAPAQRKPYVSPIPALREALRFPQRFTAAERKEIVSLLKQIDKKMDEARKVRTSKPR